MRTKSAIIMLIAFSFLWTGCNFKKQENKEEKEKVSEPYPVTIIQDTLRASLTDETKLYPVTEDFLESFKKKAFSYQGHLITADVTLPDEWGVRCVERLPEGKELWLLQSQSREWMYLVITSGYGTQRILDLIPVAVNVAIQKYNRLETEQWNTVREPDGAFVVTKEYEWVQSLTNVSKQDYEANPEKYNRTSTFVDKYYINEMGRFDYSVMADTLPDYSVVVFFYDASQKPPEWDEYIPRLQAFCEENNIYYEEVYQNFNQVIVHDFYLNEVLNIDINPFVKDTECGILMLKRGETPKVVGFGNFDYMQIAIRRYYKLHPNIP